MRKDNVHCIIESRPGACVYHYISVSYKRDETFDRSVGGLNSNFFFLYMFTF